MILNRYNFILTTDVLKNHFFLASCHVFEKNTKTITQTNLTNLTI
jgi:hypothetical protein